MSTETPCSLQTKSSGENIICSVAKLHAQIAIELKEPWASIPMKSEYYPEELQSLLPEIGRLKLEVGLNYFAKNELSIHNHTRIFIFKNNGNEFEDFHKIELLFSNENLKSIIPQILEYLKSNINNFKKENIIDSQNTKELFICVHGERDHCCGKYGIELHNNFHKKVGQYKNSSFRVWKSSHIGGHRYAPTFYEAPAMRWYGLFNINDIDDYLNRSDSKFQIKNNYRGMSGILNKYALLAENELFKKHSWQWLEATEKKYEIININKNEEVEVNFYYKMKKSENILKSKIHIQFEKVAENIASCGSIDKKSVRQYIVSEI
ncbi:sucrase ferredoxin [Silvanigrella aquatica]|uniref:Sucrase ferredoxin n=1 Tax=Silvanigrella aquatica TaxID=1915309 RepID=A0A1L4D2E0_9BACT|nr:sucrase ferredoxin [Silvanigrella aquatica]APJ04362.1 hypothetical protein AXG55_10775 [Silvanigrella aquatica]